MPSCPNCGETLVAVPSPGPTSPTWVSESCARAWFDAELTVEARQAWNPATRSFDDPAVAGAVADELEGRS